MDMWDVQSNRYSLNNRCHFSNCILAVLAMLLGSSLAIFSSRNVWNVPPFSTALRCTKTTQPRPRASHLPSLSLLN